jgi:hypothetical protein
MATPTVVLAPARISRLLFVFLALLALGQVLGLIASYFLGYDDTYGLVSLFNLDAEHNVPSYFSTCLLLLNAVLFLAVWRAARAGGRHAVWLLLALVFLFLSLDEDVALHERLSIPVRTLFNTSGLLYFAWVIPYLALVAVLAAITLPILMRQNREIRFGFSLATVLYLTGSVGFEMLSGWYIEGRPDLDFTYGVLALFEETLEMAGLIVLTHTLLSLLGREYRGFVFRIPATNGPGLRELARAKVAHLEQRLRRGSNSSDPPMPKKQMLPPSDRA